MNSLRTDDILGAKPRVRHMPKDLIRERRVPAAYFPNIQADNPEWNPHPEHYPVHPYNQKFSNIEYQNNDPNGIPFVPRHKLTKEPKYINYDLPRGPLSSENRIYSQSRADQPQIMRAASELRNGSERKESPRDDSARYSQRQRYERINKSMESIDNTRRENEEKRSEVQSRRSFDMKDKSLGNQTKNLFRGLGFNIITNHKYEYTFQHKKPTNY